jgi:putative ABC transport system substrate-binding protein
VPIDEALRVLGDPGQKAGNVDCRRGNVTGFANLEATLGGKWLELLSQIVPALKRAAIMFNPDSAPVSTYMPSFEAAARSVKARPITASVHSDAEIEMTIIALGREPGGGLVVMPGSFIKRQRYNADRSTAGP